MTTAHLLTFFRMLAGPLFFLLYLFYESLGLSLFTASTLLLLLLFLSELSDALDGYFARRFGQQSEVGKVFDPMADSIYRLSVFLAFTKPPIELPLYVFYIFLYRDLLMTTLRTTMAVKGIALGARFSGKLKAIFQGIAELLVLLLLVLFAEDVIEHQTLTLVSFWIVLLTALFSVFSLGEYLVANRSRMFQ